MVRVELPFLAEAKSLACLGKREVRNRLELEQEALALLLRQRAKLTSRRMGEAKIVDLLEEAKSLNMEARQRSAPKTWELRAVADEGLRALERPLEE